MRTTKEQYQRMCKKAETPSTYFKDFAIAFVVGGSICVFGQLLTELYERAGMDVQTAGSLVSVTLVGLAALFTGIGWYDRLARHAGAGTLVPITGFANAVVSPALEFKSEGLVLGSAAKMFLIAGPVIVFGMVTAAAAGVVVWLAGVL